MPGPSASERALSQIRPGLRWGAGDPAGDSRHTFKNTGCAPRGRASGNCACGRDLLISDARCAEWSHLHGTLMLGLRSDGLKGGGRGGGMGSSR